MDVIACHTFQEQTIQLDNKHFVDCTFVGCVLEYTGEKLGFESCRFSGCRYLFTGPALRTVELLEALGFTTECLSGAPDSMLVH